MGPQQDGKRRLDESGGGMVPLTVVRPSPGTYDLTGEALLLRPAELTHLAPLASGSTFWPDARYVAAFDVVPLALALVDERLRLVRTNARFRAMFAMPNSHAPDRFVHEVFPVGESDLTAAIISAARGLPGVATTVLLRVGDDSRAVMASCLPVPGDPSDADVLVVLREVHESDPPASRAPTSSAGDEPQESLGTDGHSQEAAPSLRGRKHGLEISTVEHARSRERRLAAVGQLTAGVMHDVNNALNPIVAAAYLLNLHADDPEMVRHLAARISAAAETGAATAARVGRMLRQEPVEDAEQHPIELAVLADEVLAMTRPLWEERARGGPVLLVRELEPDVWVHGVAGEIREALLNLVHNALDAMERGGTLTARCYISEGRAVLEVQDDGVGMTAEVADHAFDPFFTTKGANGSGLGLAEVYGIMRRCHGVPELRSSPGLGTLVRLSFPRAEPGEVVGREGRLRNASRRILVVEDNPDNREFIRALLHSDGHKVDVATGVSDALALLSQRQAGPSAFDLVVTDVGLLDGSGWELIGAARERWPDLRLGIVTGWESSAEGDVDVDFVLRKPIRTDSLLAAVVEKR